MELIILRAAIVLVASAIGAYTDFRTGEIFDYITYPLIGIGILLNAFELFLGNFVAWQYFALGAAVFVLGYIAYFAGKIGGGDVKLFVGIALVLPFFGESFFPLNVFLINALFAAAILAVIGVGIYYLLKYAKKGMNLNYNRQGIIRAALLAILFGFYFYFGLQFKAINLLAVQMLAFPVAIAILFIAFEKGIKKEFFLKKVKLSELEEDEVIAFEFLEEKEKKELELKFKGVIGEKEKEKLEKAGIKEMLVYRALPRFGPFVFFGIAIVLLKPELIQLLFG